MLTVQSGDAILNTEMPILMSDDELTAITGYRQPAAQLRELIRRGFWRARRQPISGKVALERAHYEAVCSGAVLGGPIKKPEPEPMLASEMEAFEAARRKRP